MKIYQLLITSPSTTCASDGRRFEVFSFELLLIRDLDIVRRNHGKSAVFRNVLATAGQSTVVYALRHLRLHVFSYIVSTCVCIQFICPCPKLYFIFMTACIEPTMRVVARLERRTSEFPTKSISRPLRRPVT